MSLAKDWGKRIKLGIVGVDSGQLLIVDPAYLDDWDNKDDNFEEPKSHLSYGKVSKLTLYSDYHSENQGQLLYERGHAGLGVAFRSGLGDGVYAVFGYLKDVDGWGERLTKVEIILIEEESEKHKELTKHLIGKRK